MPCHTVLLQVLFGFSSGLLPEIFTSPFILSTPSYDSFLTCLNYGNFCLILLCVSFKPLLLATSSLNDLSCHLAPTICLSILQLHLRISSTLPVISHVLASYNTKDLTVGYFRSLTSSPFFHTAALLFSLFSPLQPFSPTHFPSNKTRVLILFSILK